MQKNLTTKIALELGLAPTDVIATSSLKKTGLEKISEIFDKFITK